jgi:hypothetical protein
VFVVEIASSEIDGRACLGDRGAEKNVERADDVNIFGRLGCDCILDVDFWMPVDRK